VQTPLGTLPPSAVLLLTSSVTRELGKLGSVPSNALDDKSRSVSAANDEIDDGTAPESDADGSESSVSDFCSVIDDSTGLNNDVAGCPFTTRPRSASPAICCGRSSPIFALFTNVSVVRLPRAEKTEACGAARSLSSMSRAVSCVSAAKEAGKVPPGTAPLPTSDRPRRPVSAPNSSGIDAGTPGKVRFLEELISIEKWNKPSRMDLQGGDTPVRIAVDLLPAAKTGILQPAPVGEASLAIAIRVVEDCFEAAELDRVLDLLGILRR
jgi:hypothetical protein